jgi:hypothetical protein
MTISRLNMEVVSEVFCGLTSIGENVDARAVQTRTNAISRFLKKLGVALFWSTPRFSDEGIIPIRIVVQRYRDPYEIAHRVVAFLAVFIHPNFAVVQFKIREEGKCFWLYHGRTSYLMATANPLQHSANFLVRLFQRVGQEFVARTNVRYQEAESLR